MLVTDLSQSPDLRVLSTSRLSQILLDMKMLEEPTTQFGTVREIAVRARANKVVLGSFARLGDTIRIGYKIQDAATGEIFAAQSVDATAPEELFSRVDELSRRIRQSFRLPLQPVTAADRNLADVSTSSVEAYRYFVEAEKLHHRLEEDEAIELYLAAVEADPALAMAWAKLSSAHRNLGQQTKAQEYAERAMEHLDRLTVPERAYVEGRYYGRKLETVGKAIETYTEALERYPHLTSLTSNLGILYRDVGLFEEAIVTFEQGVRYGDDFPGTHSNLARLYFATGDAAHAREVVDDYLVKHPETCGLYRNLAEFHASQGELAEARAALEDGERLRPESPFWTYFRYVLAVLDENWQAAAAAADRLGETARPSSHSTRLALLTQVRAYRGELGDLQADADRAIASYPSPGRPRAQAYAA